MVKVEIKFRKERGVELPAWFRANTSRGFLHTAILDDITVPNNALNATESVRSQLQSRLKELEPLGDVTFRILEDIHSNKNRNNTNNISAAFGRLTTNSLVKSQPLKTRKVKVMGFEPVFNRPKTPSPPPRPPNRGRNTLRRTHKNTASASIHAMMNNVENSHKVKEQIAKRTKLLSKLKSENSRSKSVSKVPMMNRSVEDRLAVVHSIVSKYKDSLDEKAKVLYDIAETYKKQADFVYADTMGYLYSSELKEKSDRPRNRSRSRPHIRGVNETELKNSIREKYERNLQPYYKAYKDYEEFMAEIPPKVEGLRTKLMKQWHLV